MWNSLTYAASSLGRRINDLQFSKQIAHFVIRIPAKRLGRPTRVHLHVETSKTHGFAVNCSSEGAGEAQEKIVDADHASLQRQSFLGFAGIDGADQIEPISGVTASGGLIVPATPTDIAETKLLARA